MQFNVLTPLKRDGMLYTQGSLLELDDEEVAAQLVKDGVIEEFTGRPEPVPATSNARTQTPEEKEAARAAKRAAKAKKTAMDTDVSDEDEESYEKPLEDMTAAELKEEAAKRDLSTSGTKAELIERILGADEAAEDNDDDL